MHSRMSTVVVAALALALFVGTGAGRSAAQSSLPRSLFVVHCEPSTATTLMFHALTKLVQDAEKRHVKLTLELTPQWIDMFLAAPGMMSTIQVWHGRGHEIAAHHHDIDHPGTWDGYTNTPPPIRRPEPYRGTMADFKRHLDRMPVTIVTGGLGTEEWPYGIPFRTQGGRKIAEAKSRPTFLVVNEYGLWRVGYTFVPDARTVARVKALHAAATGNDLIGLVTHVHNYASSAYPYRQWFDYLASRDPKGTRNVTPREVLGGLPGALAADAATLSVATGGKVNFALRTDTSRAGHAYRVVASLAGTDPGFDIGGRYAGNVHIGLNPDAVTLLTLALANTPMFQRFEGTLSAAGGATARYDTRGSLPTSLVGLEVHFVFVATSAGTITFSSNAVGVRFVS